MTWLGRLLSKNRLEAELRKELEYHARRQTDEYLEAGLSEEEARRRVRLKFGGTEQISEACREARGTLWLESLLQDLRFSQRVLRKSPGFTTAAIVMLALGIGANVAIFRLLDAVRLRTLPVKDPQRLAILELADRTGWRGNQAAPYAALTNPVWEQFRNTQQSFSGVLAWGNAEFNVAPGGAVRLAHGLFVSGNFFQVLGVRPLLGRAFRAVDDRSGCGTPGAVVSYSFWQRELAGNTSVVGRKLTINFQKVEIIGVTPEGFSGLEIGRSYDIAVPICSQAVLWNEGDWLNAGTVWWLTVMGRLKPEETCEQANVQLRAMSPALFRATLPPNYPAADVKGYLKFKLKATPASAGVSVLREQYENSLLLLLATTGLVLLIACANLANLILVRATARTHEFAVRLAIGASRWRLIQQLATEAALLTASGVAAGLALSDLLSRSLIAFLSSQGDTLFLDLQPDWRMFGFTALVASLTCLAFGLTPAFQSTRGDAAEAAKTNSRTLSTSHKQLGLRRFLVVAQVSVSLVLLVGALLFSGSLRNLLAVDPGFKENGILLTNLDFSRVRVPTEQRITFRHSLVERVRAVPGVVSAGEVAILPLSGNGIENSVWRRGTAMGAKTNSNFNWLGPGYLRTMGITLLAGRDFDDHDTPSSPKVALVNQSFARKLGFGTDPIGQRFHREATPSEPETTFEIVGLVKDTKYYTLREEFAPIAFLAITESAESDPFQQIAVRSSTNLGATTSGVRSVIESVSPSIDLDFQAFENTVRSGLMRERLMAMLSGFFGGLAALIASVGLYGVMSYLVGRRTKEIGVRIALGADRRSIIALILREAAGLLSAGIGIGLLFALAVTRAASGMLFGMRPYDPGTLTLATALLSIITLAASYLPARRAGRQEPMTALRTD